MEAITIKLDSRKYKSKPYTLFQLTDAHTGAASFAEPAFKKAVKIIAEEGDGWLGGGDQLDCINHKDKRFNPLEVAERYKIKDLANLPVAQAEHFLELTQAIHSKCLGLIEGNHEQSFRRYNSFDVNDHLAKHMNTVNLRSKAWVNLSFTDGNIYMPVTIAICHGAGGGGMREGYPINKCHDTFRWDIADIKLMGHLHNMATDRAEFNSYVYGKIRKNVSLYGIGGCFMLKSVLGHDGYFEQRPGKESSIGMLRIDIYPYVKKREDMRIEMSKIYL